MKKKLSMHQHLIGMTKKEVFRIQGDEFNHYPLNSWTYYLRADWIGRKVYLIVKFENNRVIEVKIVKSWH
jgi:hypothetical protein